MTARALRWLPPALLVAVGLNQIWLSRSVDLTPWCGGGFGMFSTNDGRFTRHLHARALGPGMRFELDLPVDVEEGVQAAIALPSESRLRALARELAPLANSDFEPPESIRLEVYGTRWDADTLAPTGVLLRAVEVPVEGP